MMEACLCSLYVKEQHEYRHEKSFLVVPLYIPLQYQSGFLWETEKDRIWGISSVGNL